MPRSKLLLLAVSIVAVACGGGPDATTLGADLYEVSCARCHGDNLEGGIAPALGPGSPSATSLSDDQLIGAIRIGPGAMPGFGRLSDEQVRSVVDYLREVQAQD